MTMLFPQSPPPFPDDGLPFDPSHPHYASVPLVRLTAAGETAELVVERGVLPGFVDQRFLRAVVESKELVGVGVGVLANAFGDVHLDVVAVGGDVPFDHRYTYELVLQTDFDPVAPTTGAVVDALELLAIKASRGVEHVGDDVAAGWVVSNAGVTSDGKVVVRFHNPAFQP